MKPIEEFRNVLRNDRWKDLGDLVSDQQKGVPPPPLQKPCPQGAELHDLVAPKDIKIGGMALRDVIQRRRSRRQFLLETLTPEELSFLLWATQGVLEVRRDGAASLRTVPSAGGRHTFETYLIINRVNGFQPGLYRYLPLDHKLCFLYSDPDLPEKISEACCGQTFVGSSAVVFLWTTIPYRMEWRYSVASPKVIAIDAGHVCQNLYLAAESIGAGTCAIGAYFQDKVDAILGLDGKDEFTIYLAPVGRIG
jgi:SagB-type dehydrogenase family enzyme